MKNKKDKEPKAPQWLIGRMERLRRLPPPTQEEVEVQIEACVKFQKEQQGLK